MKHVVRYGDKVVMYEAVNGDVRCSSIEMLQPAPGKPSKAHTVEYVHSPASLREIVASGPCACGDVRQQAIYDAALAACDEADAQRGER